MAVKLRLTRVGSKKNPIYRVVVADARSPGTTSSTEVTNRNGARCGSSDSGSRFTGRPHQGRGDRRAPPTTGEQDDGAVEKPASRPRCAGRGEAAPPAAPERAEAEGAQRPPGAGAALEPTDVQCPMPRPPSTGMTAPVR